MSRRSRRRNGAGKTPWLGRLLGVFAGLVVLVIVFGYFGARAYLHSDGFRKFLSAEVSRVAKVNGWFDPFRWDGLAVGTDGFHATGEGVVGEIELGGIDTEVGLGGLGRGVWEVKATRISRLEVAVDLTKKGEPAPTEPAERKKKVMETQPGWVPSKVELDSLEISEIVVKALTASGEISAKGLRLKAKPEKGGKAFGAEITGGTVDLPTKRVPEIRVGHVFGAYRDGSVFITDADAEIWEIGRIHAFGEWNPKSGGFSFAGDINELKCAEILNENWARRLTGDVSSTFSAHNISGSTVITGELGILNGTMTALPMLDALAAYADTRRFRVLQLSEARMKWRHTKDELLLTDIAMGSEGLIRIEGSIAIRGQAIDGRFRLGLVPGTLSNIPGAETSVFVPGTHGLLWAPLHVTGTLDDPEEDLTERLIAAAGMRMFEKLPETGETVLRFTQKAIGTDPGGAIEKALGILEKGEEIIGKGGDVIGRGKDVIDAAGGILDGVLGGGILRPKPPEDIPGKDGE